RHDDHRPVAARDHVDEVTARLDLIQLRLGAFCTADGGIHKALARSTVHWPQSTNTVVAFEAVLWHASPPERVVARPATRMALSSSIVVQSQRQALRPEVPLPWRVLVAASRSRMQLL